MLYCEKCGGTPHYAKRMCRNCYDKYYNRLKGKVSEKQLKRDLLNEEYFSGELKENQSYFIGILHSDGWLVDRTNEIKQSGIGLKMNDFDIVEEFAKEINWEDGVRLGTRKVGNDFARIEFSSDKMFNDLQRIGVTVDKTINQIFPNGIVLKDYIRGLIDGDGSISRNNCRWTFIVTGEGIKEAIEKEFIKLGFNFNVIKSYKNTIFQQYTFYGKGGKKGYLEFLDWIYDSNGYRGIRKYNIYKTFKMK